MAVSKKVTTPKVVKKRRTRLQMQELREKEAKAAAPKKPQEKTYPASAVNLLIHGIKLAEEQLEADLAQLKENNEYIKKLENTIKALTPPPYQDRPVNTESPSMGTVRDEVARPTPPTSTFTQFQNDQNSLLGMIAENVSSLERALNMVTGPVGLPTEIAVPEVPQGNNIREYQDATINHLHRLRAMTETLRDRLWQFIG